MRPMTAVWLTGCSAAVLFAGLAWYLAPLRPGILAIQFAFTPEAFAKVISAWPPEHLARYRAHLPIDLLLLLSYGSFGHLLSTHTGLFSGWPAALRGLATLALPVAAAFDALENALHWWLTAEPHFGQALPYALSGAAAAAKWSLLLAFGGLAAHALFVKTES